MKNLRLPLALLTLYLVWGSTYLANRLLVMEVPGLLGAGLRCALAGAILVGIALARGRPLPARAAWVAAAKAGTPLVLGGTSLVAVAQQTVSSGLAALVLASIPAQLVLWTWRIEGTRPRAVHLLGCALGAVGVGLLVGAEWSGGGAVALLVVASSGWALGSVLLRSPSLPRDPSLAMGMAIGVGGATSLAVGFALGDRLVVLSPHALGALAWLVLAGSVVGGTVFAWLVRVASAPVAGSYALVNPLVAIGLGVWFGGEHVTGAMVLGGLVVLAGLGLLGVPVVPGVPGVASRVPAPVEPEEEAAAAK